MWNGFVTAAVSSYRCWWRLPTCDSSSSVSFSIAPSTTTSRAAGSRPSPSHVNHRSQTMLKRLSLIERSVIRSTYSPICTARASAVGPTTGGVSAGSAALGSMMARQSRSSARRDAACIHARPMPAAAKNSVRIAIQPRNQRPASWAGSSRVGGERKAGPRADALRSEHGMHDVSVASAESPGNRNGCRGEAALRAREGECPAREPGRWGSWA